MRIIAVIAAVVAALSSTYVFAAEEQWLANPILTQAPRLHCQQVGGFTLCFRISQDRSAIDNLQHPHACEWMIVSNPYKHTEVTGFGPFYRNKEVVCPLLGKPHQLVVPHFVALGNEAVARIAPGVSFRFQVMVDEDDPAGCLWLGLRGAQGTIVSLRPHRLYGELVCPGGCSEGHGCTN
jgi:hypothetical protein